MHQSCGNIPFRRANGLPAGASEVRATVVFLCLEVRRPLLGRVRGSGEMRAAPGRYEGLFNRVWFDAVLLCELPGIVQVGKAVLMLSCEAQTQI